jgi:hypothetical protein
MSGAVCLPGGAIRAGEATVEELREVMGVPKGVYRDWCGIREKVIEPAIAAVNQIADFVASYRLEHGPRNKVMAVELWFRPKPPAERNAAAAELNRSRVGRKARRLGLPPRWRANMLASNRAGM